MKEDGYFITSGIIDDRADEVAQKIENSDLTILNRYESNGWVCFVIKAR